MPSRFSTTYFLLVGGVFLWLSSVVAAPLARFHEWTIAPFLYLFFYPVCHQIPERSFVLLDYPLAVCARCTGLYAGFLLGLVLVPFLPRFWSALQQRPRLLLLFFIPMAIDLLVANTHLSRFLSGSMASFPTALFVWLALEQLLVIPKPRRL